MLARRFILEAAAFATIQFVLLAMFLGRFYDPGVAFPQYRAHPLKHDRLRDAGSPRLILVGGSNLMYGIESEYIAANTTFQPVNMGLVGGLGLSFMLKEVDDQVRDDDLVVLSIEYLRLSPDFDAANPQLLLRVMEQRPSSAANLTLSQWRMLMDSAILDQLGFAFRKAWRHALHGWPLRDPISATHNEFGDLLIYRPGRDDAPRSGAQNTLPRQIDPEKVIANLERINAIARQWKARGATVVFSYPPIPRSQFESRSELARRIDALLRQHLTIPVIDQPQDMVFDDDQFVVPSYHLYGEGIRERTRRLVEAVETPHAD